MKTSKPTSWIRQLRNGISRWPYPSEDPALEEKVVASLRELVVPFLEKRGR
jgi:hypothetical protein